MMADGQAYRVNNTAIAAHFLAIYDDASSARFSPRYGVNTAFL